MGNVQSRRAVREEERKKNARKYVALGGAAAILLAGGTLAFTLSQKNDTSNTAASSALPSSCDTAQHVSIATNNKMAEVLKQVPINAENCIALDISTDKAPADIASEMVNEKNAPNLWIPDSSTRAKFLLKGQGKTTAKSDSLAKTPGILVTKNSTNHYATWTDALSDTSQVAMGNPQENSGAFVSLINAAAEVTNSKASDQALTAATRLRAQTTGVTAPPKDATGLLDDVANGNSDTAIVTESDYAAYLNAHPDADLKASVPSTGSQSLDYPMYQLTSTENNKTINSAAKQISDYLASDKGKAALAAAGLRTPDNTTLQSKASVGPVADLTASNQQVVSDIWRLYALKSAPLNAIVSVDTSGSMGWEIAGTGKTRMQVTLEALLAGSQLFPARDNIGLWTFSENLGKDANGNQVDYKELVPVRALTADVSGQTQRQVLQAAASKITPDPDKGTALNNTLLAQFEAVKKNYKAGDINLVLLMTDGENHTANSISTEDLIAKIKSEQDPNNPVIFLLVGISQDANMDALNNIASQVGGEAYQANSAADIQRIFQEVFTSLANK